MDELRVETAPAAEDLQFLDDRIYEFNAATTGVDDGTFFTILVRDDAGAILAGLHGWTWGDCCEIKTLWVRVDRRRTGLGSRLLAAAEAEARRRGARQIVLASHTFQAPSFYHRHGYETVFVLDGYPSPHGQHHLRKRLA
jgi:GNAT superfamily N-acetyltransferase